MKLEMSVTVLLLLIGIFGCAKQSVLAPLFYTPPIYFAGYFNGDYDSLTGNSEFPNACYLNKDTISMVFYSSKFEEANQIRQGDFIKMDTFPGNDSAVGRARILFHMARYHESNCSYTITPADTIYGLDRIKIYVENINRISNGVVDLRDVTVSARPLSGTNGQYLEIIHGRVRGTIQ
jgi:hypothetical protein